VKLRCVSFAEKKRIRSKLALPKLRCRGNTRGYVRTCEEVATLARNAFAIYCCRAGGGVIGDDAPTLVY
jgi:hypothetical protein